MQNFHIPDKYKTDKTGRCWVYILYTKYYIAEVRMDGFFLRTRTISSINSTLYCLYSKHFFNKKYFSILIYKALY